jgi:hypothetical protein
MASRLTFDDAHGRVPREETARTILAAHLLVSAAFISAAFLGSLALLPTSAWIRWECGIVSVYAVWLIWSWRAVARGLFNPYGLFLIAALLFNAGQAFLEVFGWNSLGLLGGLFTLRALEDTLMLVLVSLAALQFGALLAVLLSRRSQREWTDPQGRNSGADATVLRVIGSVLLAISIVPMALVVRDALNVVALAGYGGLYDRDFVTGFQAGPQVLASLLVPGAMFLLAGSRTNLRGRLVSGGVIVAYTALMLFLGYRAIAILPILMWAWLYHRTVRPIKGWLLFVAGSLLASLVFPLVRAVRDTSLVDRVYFGYLASFFSTDNPILSTISEMGSSMATVAYTVTLVPASRSFDFGSGYAYSLLTIVPNVFWPLHPTIAHGTYAAWLTQSVSPGYVRPGSLGFSFIAEAFVNFGWLGLFVIGLIGFGFGSLYVWANKSSDPARLAAIASYFSFILLFARGESNLLIRPLFWYSLFPYATVLLITRWVRRARSDRIMLTRRSARLLD